jgi:hypothetical protein
MSLYTFPVNVPRVNFGCESTAKPAISVFIKAWYVDPIGQYVNTIEAVVYRLMRAK